MNWFLLIFILKLLTVILAAPIDKQDTKDGITTATENLENILSHEFVVAEDANNLKANKDEDKIEHLLITTLSPLEYLSENFKENINKTLNNTQSFNVEVTKTFEDEEPHLPQSSDLKSAFSSALENFKDDLKTIKDETKFNTEEILYTTPTSIVNLLENFNKLGQDLPDTKLNVNENVTEAYMELQQNLQEKILDFKSSLSPSVDILRNFSNLENLKADFSSIKDKVEDKIEEISQTTSTPKVNLSNNLNKVGENLQSELNPQESLEQNSALRPAAEHFNEGVKFLENVSNFDNVADTEAKIEEIFQTTPSSVVNLSDNLNKLREDLRDKLNDNENVTKPDIESQENPQEILEQNSALASSIQHFNEGVKFVENISNFDDVAANLKSGKDEAVVKIEEIFQTTPSSIVNLSDNLNKLREDLQDTKSKQNLQESLEPHPTLRPSIEYLNEGVKFLENVGNFDNVAANWKSVKNETEAKIDEILKTTPSSVLNLSDNLNKLGEDLQETQLMQNPQGSLEQNSAIRPSVEYFNEGVKFVEYVSNLDNVAANLKSGKYEAKANIEEISQITPTSIVNLSNTLNKLREDLQETQLMQNPQESLEQSSALRPSVEYFKEGVKFVANVSNLDNITANLKSVEDEAKANIEEISQITPTSIVNLSNTSNKLREDLQDTQLNDNENVTKPDRESGQNPQNNFEAIRPSVEHFNEGVKFLENVSNFDSRAANFSKSVKDDTESKIEQIFQTTPTSIVNLSDNFNKLREDLQDTKLNDNENVTKPDTESQQNPQESLEQNSALRPSVEYFNLKSVKDETEAKIDEILQITPTSIVNLSDNLNKLREDLQETQLMQNPPESLEQNSAVRPSVEYFNEGVKFVDSVSNLDNVAGNLKSARTEAEAKIKGILQTNPNSIVNWSYNLNNLKENLPDTKLNDNENVTKHDMESELNPQESLEQNSALKPSVEYFNEGVKFLENVSNLDNVAANLKSVKDEAEVTIEEIFHTTPTTIGNFLENINQLKEDLQNSNITNNDNVTKTNVELKQNSLENSEQNPAINHPVDVINQEAKLLENISNLEKVSSDLKSVQDETQAKIEEILITNQTTIVKVIENVQQYPEVLQNSKYNENVTKSDMESEQHLQENSEINSTLSQSAETVREVVTVIGHNDNFEKAASDLISFKKEGTIGNIPIITQNLSLTTNFSVIPEVEITIADKNASDLITLREVDKIEKIYNFKENLNKIPEEIEISTTNGEEKIQESLVQNVGILNVGTLNEADQVSQTDKNLGNSAVNFSSVKEEVSNEKTTESPLTNEHENVNTFQETSHDFTIGESKQVAEESSEENSPLNQTKESFIQEKQASNINENLENPVEELISMKDKDKIEMIIMTTSTPLEILKENLNKNSDDSQNSKIDESALVTEPEVGQDLLQIAAKLIEDEDKIERILMTTPNAITILTESPEEQSFKENKNEILTNNSENTTTVETNENTTTENTENEQLQINFTTVKEVEEHKNEDEGKGNGNNQIEQNDTQHQVSYSIKSTNSSEEVEATKPKQQIEKQQQFTIVEQYPVHSFQGEDQITATEMPKIQQEQSTTLEETLKEDNAEVSTTTEIPKPLEESTEGFSKFENDRTAEVATSQGNDKVFPYPAAIKNVMELEVTTISNMPTEVFTISTINANTEDSMKDSKTTTTARETEDLTTSVSLQETQRNFQQNEEKEAPKSEPQQETTINSKHYTQEGSIIYKKFKEPNSSNENHALNKEEILKPIIEKEYHQELQQTQEENTTIFKVPSQESNAVSSPITITPKEDSTIITTSLTPPQEFTSNASASTEDTTSLPMKFEEELNMAVKALEETTHHHFEEFQLNLKKAFKSFTDWEAEHMNSTTSTMTTEDNTKSEDSTTQPPTHIETSTEKSVDEATLETIKPLREEVPQLGVINENFIDKFQENFMENSLDVTTHKETEVTTTVEPVTNKEEIITTPATTTNTTNEQTPETTMAPNDLTTVATPEEEEVQNLKEQFAQLSVSRNKASEEMTTIKIDLNEEQSTVKENDIQETTTKSQETTTEDVDAETTIVPLFARVQLQQDVNSVSLTKYHDDSSEEEIIGEHFVKVDNDATQNQMTMQQQQEKQIDETVTTAMETSQLGNNEEQVVHTTPEIFSQDMVKFIEQQDSTTLKQEEFAQTQLPRTQASFMEEHQQQIESTTQNDVQSHTAAAAQQYVPEIVIENETTTTTRTNESTTLTPVAEVYSTTIVEAEILTATPAITQTEPEARSLALPPPKLEYLQNEDGVEVFYGYSIVKRN